MTGLIPATDAFPWPTLNIDTHTLLADMAALVAQGTTYGLGAKSPSLGCKPSAIHSIDCSGYLRWAIYSATHGATTFVDGSASQHDQVIRAGFKRSDVTAGANRDGAVRIAFLTPEAGGGVGHVMLVLDGFTCESHGSRGPDRRAWDVSAHPFMGRCSVFVLSPPTPPA